MPSKKKTHIQQWLEGQFSSSIVGATLKGRNFTILSNHTSECLERQKIIKKQPQEKEPREFAIHRFLENYLCRRSTRDNHFAIHRFHENYSCRRSTRDNHFLCISRWNMVGMPRFIIYNVAFLTRWRHPFSRTTINYYAWSENPASQLRATPNYFVRDRWAINRSDW